MTMTALSLLTGLALAAIGPKVTDAAMIADGGTYLLKNSGRNAWLLESPYTTLDLGAEPPTGVDSGLDYVVTIARGSDGCFTFRTRRGRYIPEVGDCRPATVGNEEGAGRFAITKADGRDAFVITNTVDTAYGFDGTATAFVGWNAGQGDNCFYEIYEALTGPADYPLETWTEEADDMTRDPQPWLGFDSDSTVWTWASKNVAYKRHEFPQVELRSDTAAAAWRGERLGLQALILAPNATGALRLESSEEWAEPRFVRYVLADDFNNCGNHPADLPAYATGDIIDSAGTLELEARSVRPVWVTLEVPRDIAAGNHELTFSLVDDASGMKAAELTLTLAVADRTLPLPSDQKFHLDFWQQPYAISRYHGVTPWSDAHFEAMKPYMQLLARAGQKTVSAVLFHEPWGNQSHDKFDPMVETIKKADGTWKFDYSVFDRWVEFMDSCGINSQINCYSMIPWDMTFRYSDEATDTYQFLRTATTSDEYKALWRAFLTDFASHLKGKGWYDKTCIAMDERGLADMTNAYNLLQETVPGMKMALAGNHHSELADKLHDYCIAYGQNFSAAELEARKAAGMTTTIYTSCADQYPNIFSCSAPVEAAYLPLNAIARGFDGYLHWALFNWDDHPLTDSRFRLFGSGDTYCIYPGARSSLRFERMIEGIQQAEKVALLRAEGGDNSEMERWLSAIASGKFTGVPTPACMINKLETILNNPGNDARVNEIAEPGD